MKRDMDVVKRLMLLIEENEDDSHELTIPSDIDRTVAVYHLKILEQAGFTKNNFKHPGDGVLWIYSSLTWDGHDFLGTLKNDKAVELAEAEAEKQGAKFADLPFEVMKALLISSTKQLLGL